MYGIRYIVIALGGPEEKATDEDCEAIKEIIEKSIPMMTATVLSEHVSNKVTLALLQERGIL